MKQELTNALYPHLSKAELSPGQFMQEWRNGRSDMRTSADGTPSINDKAKSTKKLKLTEPVVRYIRENYKTIGKAKLAEMFSISDAFCYKIASKRAMEEVKDEGPMYDPAEAEDLDEEISDEYGG